MLFAGVSIKMIFPTKFSLAIAPYINVTCRYLPTTLAIFAILFNQNIFAKEQIGWLDNVQTGVTHSIDASANWIDDFFEQSNETEQAEAFAKVRLGLIPIEGDWQRFESKIRLRAKLPNLKNKWDIIVSDYDDNNEQSITDEAINDTNGTQREEQLNLAIRVTHSLKDNQYISSRIGFAKGADLYIKTRYKRSFTPLNWLKIELEPALYYYLNHGWASRVNLDFELAKTERGLLRQTNSWESIQDEDSPTWRQSLLYYYQLNTQSAIIGGAFATGEIEQGYRYNNKGFFARYRCQAIRKWIYFEVEPFVHFPDYREFERTYGIALRVEANFGNN